MALLVLRTMQLELLGKVIRSPEESLLRSVSFISGTLQTATSRYIRRVGRPRKEWVTTVLPEALRRTHGSSQQLEHLAGDPSQWKYFLRSGA